MRMRTVLLLLVSMGIGVQAKAQTGPGSERGSSDNAASRPQPVDSSVTDPACPVTHGAPPLPLPRELHVLYFPTAMQATIHDPKSLVLHVAFDDGSYNDDIRTASFTRRDDGVWQASLALQAMKNEFAIYWVEEPETKIADTNRGKYFEVMFCDVHGERPETAVEYRALSYNGWLEPHGFSRPADYPRVVQILTDNIHPPNKGEFLIYYWWLYKYLLGGQTDETRAALITEIQQFVHDHEADGFGFVGTMSFAETNDWIPIELGKHIADVIEKKHKWFEDPRVEFLMERASHESDFKKRQQDLRDLIARYPNSPWAADAGLNLFSETDNLVEKEELFAWLSMKSRSQVDIRLSMAQAYLDAKTRYRIALTLIDDAEKMCNESLKNTAVYPTLQQHIRDEIGSAEMIRAEILIQMGKPKKAVDVLWPRKDNFHRGHSFYVLGTALEQAGRQHDALDAYMEGAVRAGQSQREANDAMVRLWFKLKMGSREEMLSRTETISARVFHEKGYNPTLVSRPAPEFDLTTMGGEHFSLASLRGKPVVLNFWATWCGPCVLELKGLEQFQAKHPEVVVLTVIKDDTEFKDLQNVLKEQHVSDLRISEVPAAFFDRFGALGVPHTFVIDEGGSVRVHHFEGLEDATRYLEADFAAIREAKAGSGEVMK
jgi:thiol-disulfide isomerase/thioredoxin